MHILKVTNHCILYRFGMLYMPAHCIQRHTDKEYIYRKYDNRDMERTVCTEKVRREGSESNKEEEDCIDVRQSHIYIFCEHRHDEMVRTPICKEKRKGKKIAQKKRVNIVERLEQELVGDNTSKFWDAYFKNENSHNNGKYTVCELVESCLFHMGKLYQIKPLLGYVDMLKAEQCVRLLKFC